MTSVGEEAGRARAARETETRRLFFFLNLFKVPQNCQFALIMTFL